MLVMFRHVSVALFCYVALLPAFTSLLELNSDVLTCYPLLHTSMLERFPLHFTSYLFAFFFVFLSW